MGHHKCYLLEPVEILYLRSSVVIRSICTYKHRLLWLGIAFNAHIPVALTQTFMDMSELANIDVNASGYNGTGITVVDFNQDGLDDIVCCDPDSTVFLFANDGEGSFTPTPFLTNVLGARMASFVDLDNDGDLDVFVTCFDAPNRVIENASGTYSDVSEGSGLWDINDPSYGHCWADINLDGHLDVYVTNYAGNAVVQTPNALFLGNGDLTFTEAAEDFGIDNGIRASFMPTWFDANRDGLMDLFVINDRVLFPNALFLNNGDQTFSDVTFAWNMVEYFDAMCNTVGDPNNDGYHDIYVTNTATGNFLYIHEDNTYINQAGEQGLLVDAFSWGSNWGDWDNDGDEDLAVSTANLPVQNAFGSTFIFMNNGAAEFELNTGSPTSEEGATTYSNATGDFNQDGRLDLVTFSESPTGVGVWLNDFDLQNHLQLFLEATTSHHQAIGAQVEVWTGDHLQFKTLMAGCGYLSQNSYTLHFGMGQATQADVIQVTWPSGAVEFWYNVDVNQLVTLTEGSGQNLVISSLTDGLLCPGDSLLLSATPTWTENLVWNTGQTGSSIWVDTPGYYTVSAELTSGQTVLSDSLLVSFDPTEVALEFESPTCFPDSLSTLFFTGPDSAAIAVLNPAALQPLPPGIHTVIYQSLAGCPQDITLETTAPAALILDAEIVPPTCFGESDGAIFPVFSGGTGPLEFSSNCDTASVGAGPCLLSVGDSLGCFVQLDLTIPQPPVLSATLNTDGMQDNGMGTLVLIPEGGTPPYGFIWNSEEGTQIWESFEPQELTWEVLDANGCSVSGSIALTNIHGSIAELPRCFPNPADDRLWLQGQLGPYEMIIRDLNGRVVLRANGILNGELSVDVSVLNTGLYSLEILTNNHRCHTTLILH